MEKVPRVGSLELAQDLAFQRWEWRFERLSWVVMGLIIAAALAGLLGNGPLSSSTLETADGTLRVHFDRFLHYAASTELKVVAMPASGQLRVWLDREYLHAFEVQAATPDPERTVASSEGILFVFRTEPGDEPIAVTFRLVPQRVGRLTGRVGTGAGERLAFGQFVYP